MDQRLESFRQQLDSAGVFLDFDGTVSDIVPVASEARPVAGARDLLESLARRARCVAVISGRSARELLAWLGPDLEIWGVHGAQRARGGRVELSEAARPYAETMTEVREEAERAVADLVLDGVAIEDKDVIVALHWRAAADGRRAEDALVAVARRLADRYGLTVAGSRKTIELRPPVELSKSAVVLRRARQAHLRAAMFVGDDTVDLPAFDALDELAGEGVAAVRVAVRSDESPGELLRRADVVVEGPAGVMKMLGELLEP